MVLLTAVAIPAPSMLAQTPDVSTQQIGHDVWTFKDGAPEDILSIGQTSDGFLWLASPTGLFRFDGSHFEPFQSPFGDHLLSFRVTAVSAPPSGGLWVGYQFGGFSFVQDGKVTNFGDLTTPTGTVWAFAQGGDGVAWAATTSGLWRYENQRWQQLGSEWNIPAGPLDQVGFDRDGALWALGEYGPTLYCLRPGSRVFRTADTSYKARSVDPLAPRYGFWWGPENEVVLRSSIDPGNPGHDGGSDDGLPTHPVLEIENGILDSNDNLWSSRHGIFSARPNADTTGQATNHRVIKSEEIKLLAYRGSSLVDREGNVWIGAVGGLHRFFYSPLIKQSLPGAGPFTVAPGAGGEVWITSGAGTYLDRVAKGKVEPHKWRGDLAGFAYTARDTTIWLGGVGGLWKMTSGRMERVALPKEMAAQAQFLQSIAQDIRGGMWVSFGRHGLFRLSDGVWTPYGGHDDLPKTGVVILFTDSAGRVWFGFTGNQVAVLDGERVTTFSAGDGLHVGTVSAFGGRGAAIWIGGESGLQQYDQGRLRSIVALDPDLLRGISGIIETPSGDLWLNGLSGILHIRQSELTTALENDDYRIKCERFGRRAGLPGLAALIRPLPSAVEGTDGRLWFVGGSGVVWIDPNLTEKPAPPVPVTIQSITADGNAYENVPRLNLPARTGSVQINYAAVSLSDPDSIRYRYMLQGMDDDWHEVPTASPVTYRNLHPGSYRFSVSASYANGSWSGIVAHVDFTMLPAFYQTTWFLALCAASGLAGIYLLFLLRLGQATRRVRVRMQTRLDERERIARELHDTLLQSVQGLILKFHAIAGQMPGEGRSRQEIDRTLDHADRVVAEARDRVRSLRGDVASLSDLPAALRNVAEEASPGRAATVKTVVEGSARRLHPMVLEETYAIGREALLNALAHSGGHHIEAELTYDPKQFRLRIRDDGRGIDPAFLEKGGRDDHWGLRGMHERAKKIGAHLQLWSRPGAGTELELVVPAATAYRADSGNARASWFRRLTGAETDER